MKVEYRLAKPEEREKRSGIAPSFPPDRYILVSQLNEHVPDEDRRLPSHIMLGEGEMMVLLKKSSLRVLNTVKHKDKDMHARMYSDMLIYLPWDNEEEFLGEACRSEDVCQEMWEEYGEAALSVKTQLNNLVKEALLS